MSNSIVDTSDQLFYKDKYPEVVQEVNGVSAMLAALPGDHKADIIISFFKDRCIKTAYLKTNELVIELVLSGSLSAYNIQELFNSFRANTALTESFEHYIQSVFAEGIAHDTSPEEKWVRKVSKMKIVYTALKDEDFRYDYGKKDVMLNELQKKLGKDRGELNQMLENL